MMAWATNNQVSHTVLKATGVPIRHIDDFKNSPLMTSVFYGLLRGASGAMQVLDYCGEDFYYIDNGYFDAKYINDKHVKEMDGTYRVIKNDTHHVFTGVGLPPAAIRRVLVLPPSPYSAMHWGTTPEDWLASFIFPPEVEARVRHKDSRIPLSMDLNWCDAVYSFNSMAVMKAIEMGKPVCDSHGILRNGTFKTYNYQEIRAFYEPKQFTLEQLKDYKWI